MKRFSISLLFSLLFSIGAWSQQSSPPALPSNLYTTLPAGSGSGISSPITVPVTVGTGGSIAPTGTGAITSTNIPTVTSVPATCVGSQSVQLSNSTPPTFYDCMNGVYILRITNFGWHRLGTVIGYSLLADQGNIFESRTIIDTTCPLLPNLLPGETCFRTWATAGFSSGGVAYWESPTSDPFAVVRSGTVTPANHAHISVSKCGSTYFLTATNSLGASTGIDLYSSASGNQDWALLQANVVVLGTSGQWDVKNLGNTHLKCAGDLDGTANVYLYYEGQNSTNNWAMGLATCSSNCFGGAATYTKNAGNPLMATSQTNGGCEVRLLNGTIVGRCHGELSIPAGGTANLPSDLTGVWTATSPTGPFTAPTTLDLQRASFDEGPNNFVGQLNKPTTLDLNGVCYMFYTATADGSQFTGQAHIKLAVANTTCAAMALTKGGSVEPGRTDGSMRWLSVNSSYAPPVPGILVGSGLDSAAAPDPGLVSIKYFSSPVHIGILAMNAFSASASPVSKINGAFGAAGMQINIGTVDSQTLFRPFLITVAGALTYITTTAYDGAGNISTTTPANVYTVRTEMAPTVPVATANAEVRFDDSVTHTPSWINNNNGISSPTGAWQCTNVTPVTVSANVATDQNLMTCSVPAGTLNRVSRSIRIWLSGVYSTPAASTTAVVVKVKLGALTLGTWTSTALAGIQATNDQFNLTSLSTTQTAGATAAFEVHGNMTIDLGVGNTVADSTFADVNTATVSSVDTTATQTLQITIAFTVASASNTATQRQLIVETVN